MIRTPIDDDASEDRTVPTDPFRRAVSYDICTQFDRSDEITCR